MESHFAIKGGYELLADLQELADVVLAQETHHSPHTYRGVVSVVLIPTYSKRTCYIVISYEQGVISFIVFGSGALVEEFKTLIEERFGPLMEKE